MMRDSATLDEEDDSSPESESAGPGDIGPDASPAVVVIGNDESRRLWVSVRGEFGPTEALSGLGDEPLATLCVMVFVDEFLDT